MMSNQPTTGAFNVKVGTETIDTAGNQLASAHANSSPVTLDTVTPTITKVVYAATENGSPVSRIDPWDTSADTGSDVYTRITFSEAPDENTLSIKYQVKKLGSAVIPEQEYSIVSSSLSSGDCSADDTGTVYTCLYTTESGLTGMNSFASYVTLFEDTAKNRGTAQSFTTAENVLLATESEVTAVFTPANGSTVTDEDTNITINFTGAIYADAAGTAFTNTTIDNTIRLGTGRGLNNIGFDATISGDNVTIDPSAVDGLDDGKVFPAVFRLVLRHLRYESDR